AEADAERGDLVADGLAQEALHRREPRRARFAVGVRGGVLIAAEDHERGVAGDLGRDLVAGVRADDGQLQAGVDEPVTEAAGVVGRVVLDHERASGHGVDLSGPAGRLRLPGMLLRGPVLRPGDAVALVSPSGPAPAERVALGVAMLESWGLKVVPT